ncbi:MAG: LysR family transcriptional regulator [Polyangiales bacterium]
MNANYGRDLDLNLLRVFAVVAESGSVTQAAGSLYLTQPAVSAALRRLTTSVGAPLFARQGRGLVLTDRGERLLAATRPHLSALVEAALSPPRFDLATSDRTIRMGLSDINESWLLPKLLAVLAKKAPRMRLISLPVQFRTVAAAFANRTIDMAVTVADEMPAGIKRMKLMQGGFVCLYDPRHTSVKSERDYFARDHVIVSYNGDLRGVVEDALRRQRRVRCSVSTFASVGDLIDGTALVATVPEVVAAHIRTTRPHLRAGKLPFTLGNAAMELLWPSALDGDESCRFVREEIVKLKTR